MTKKITKNRSKQANDETHCLMRLKERFGIELSHDEYRRLVNCLKSPGARTYDDVKYSYVSKSSNTRSIYRMNYKEIEFYAVYNRSSKSIITVLFTPEEVERQGLQYGENDDGTDS